MQQVAQLLVQQILKLLVFQIQITMEKIQNKDSLLDKQRMKQQLPQAY